MKLLSYTKKPFQCLRYYKAVLLFLLNAALTITEQNDVWLRQMTTNIRNSPWKLWIPHLFLRIYLKFALISPLLRTMTVKNTKKWGRPNTIRFLSYSSIVLTCTFPSTFALWRTMVLRSSFRNHNERVWFMVPLISQHCQPIYSTHQQVICIYFRNTSIVFQVSRKKKVLWQTVGTVLLFSIMTPLKNKVKLLSNNTHRRCLCSCQRYSILSPLALMVQITDMFFRKGT